MATRAVSISLTSNRVTMYIQKVSSLQHHQQSIPFDSKSTDSRLLNENQVMYDSANTLGFVTRNDAFFDPYHKSLEDI